MKRILALVLVFILVVVPISVSAKQAVLENVSDTDYETQAQIPAVAQYYQNP